MNTRMLKALNLVGSLKKDKSTSESLGSYLLEGLNENGFETEMLKIHSALKNHETLLNKVNEADILIFSFPLYVDCLPYEGIKVMELIAKQRKNLKISKEQGIMAIINCGFPEAQHNDTAISICRHFSKEAGFTWLGGLSLGGGEIINGKALLDMGRQVRRVVKSLNLTIKGITENKKIPDEAITLMAKPLVPKWLYLIMGTMMWKKRAKRNGCKKNLYDKPYI